MPKRKVEGKESRVEGAAAVSAGRDVPIAEQARDFARALRPGDRDAAENALAALATKLRADGQAPLLDEYVKQSPLCVELFELLEAQENEGGRMPGFVLEVLAHVLEGNFQLCAATTRTRSSVAGRVLSERLHSMYRHLSSERDMMLRACLRILAGVASQSSAFAAQLFRSFNFQHEGFVRLAGRRSAMSWHDSEKKVQKAQDVRICYVRFVLSFLKWKDPSLSGQVLTTKGFVSSAFTGLKDDDPKDIVSFLKQIRELVVLHRQLPRNAKLYAFPGFILRHLCGLLTNKDEEVVETTREFLCELCGDTFLFRPQQKHLLLDLCMALRPLREPQQEVIMVVLRTHPCVQLNFLSKFQFGLETTLTRQWVQSIWFLTRVLGMDMRDLPAEVRSAAEAHEAGARELQLSWLAYMICPRALHKTLLTQAVMHQDHRVVYAALLLLGSLVSRIRRAPAETKVDARQLEEVMLRVQQMVPELNTLLLLWQKLTQDQDTGPAAGGHKKKKRKRVKEREEWEEWEEGSEDEDKKELDDATICALLGRTETTIPQHAVYEAWCTAVAGYLEVLPRSTLDVKFEWSKLLSTVAAPLLLGGDATGAEGALARLLPCMKCVELAMRSGGRMQCVQASRSHLTWIETMLRVRGAVADPTLGEAAEARLACDGVLHRVFRDLGIFGVDDVAEAHAWLAELEGRPEQVPFFCEVLRLSTSKPGAFLGLGSGEAANEGGGGTGAQRVASPCFVVAVSRLASREGQVANQKQEAKPAKNAKLVKAVASRLALALPHIAPALEAVVRELGPWAPTGGAADGAEGEVANTEAVRQSLLSKLQRLCSTWRAPWSAPAGRPAKKRKVEAAAPDGPSAEEARRLVVIDALHSTLGTQRADEEDPIGDTSLDALRTDLAKTVSEGRPHAYCSAYALSEGVASAFSPAHNLRLGMWCLLMLIELVPALAPPCPPVLLHLLQHPMWALVLAPGMSTPAEHEPERLACSALAFHLLCQLLLAAPSVELAAACRRACVDALLPLWRSAALDAKAQRLLRRRAGSSPPAARLAEWLAEPGGSARAAVRACVEHGALEALVREHLPRAPRAAMSAAARAFLDVGGSGVPPLLRLPAALRAELLGVVAKSAEAVDGDDEAGDDDAVADFIRRALALDRGGLLALALSRPGDLPWVGDAGAAPLRRSLVPLVKQACWVSPSLRHSVAEKLSWRNCSPSSVLDLAASIAHLEPSMPCLTESGLKKVTAKSLRPLPEERQLRRLLAAAPSPRLAELLREAAGTSGGNAALAVVAAAAGPEGSESRLLEVIAAVEEALSSEASEAALQQLAAGVCEAVAATDAEPSKKCQRALKSLAKALSSVSTLAAATLLSALLARAGGEPPAWQREAAAALLGEDLQGPQPRFMLAHMALWWRHFSDDLLPGRRRLLERVRRAYAASCSLDDRLRRSILLADAESDVAASKRKREDPASGEAEANAWAFRAWCASLRVWGCQSGGGAAGAWTWALDAQRVRATIESFEYARPMDDLPPWLHGGPVAAALPGAREEAVAPAPVLGEQPYDVGYVLPFLAGQLRMLWAEYGDGSVASRSALLPVLAALASGGIVELLLVSLACEAATLRACALEALSAVLAASMFWSDSDEERRKERLKARRSRLPFRELPQVVRLLNYARESMEPPETEGGVPAALPRLTASFLSACHPVMLQPGHTLYMVVGFALCGQPAVDLQDVPLFYTLILSGQAESHELRVWLFRIIRRALVGRGGLSAASCGAGRLFGSKSAREAGMTSDPSRLTRVALARRYAVQWLLTFASSHELGSFGLWSEATSCLASVVAEHSAATPMGLGIAEWVSSQVFRSWPGASGAMHKHQAMLALTHLVADLLRALVEAIAVAPSIRCQGDVLALADALRAAAEGWAEAGRGGDAAWHPPVGLLWRSSHSLARLAKSVSTAGDCDDAESETQVVAACACAAQIAASLAATARLAAGAAADGVEGAGRDAAALRLAAVVASNGDAALPQSLELLEACPLSAVLHALIPDLVRRLLEGPVAASGPADAPAAQGALRAQAALEEVSPELERSAILALAGLSNALRRWRQGAAAAEPPPRQPAVAEGGTGLVPLLHAVAALPCGLHAGWRVQALVCTVLLQVFPTALPQEELLPLVARLPGPQRVASGLGDSGPIPAVHPEKEASWRMAAAELLGCLVPLCG